MNLEEVREFALSLEGVTEDMPFGDDCVIFRIGGKIFLCLWIGNSEARFALKLTPERNEELRAQSDGVLPAWHWNKRHWSDVYFERFENVEIQEWIKESYLLVLSKLPKAIRALYQK